MGRLSGAKRFASICSVYQKVDSDLVGGFSKRAFGDGGYLNNKPFTYAIETLKQRHADLPVDRKLIYVEPSPEKYVESRTARDKHKNGRPDAIENSLDALLVLPRYETIRQDIQNVIEWNANVARLKRVMDGPSDAISRGATAGPLASESYWRLRLSGAADQLACKLAEDTEVIVSSAEGQALRSIVGRWREITFRNRKDETRFLDLFDFDYCERALQFLRERIGAYMTGRARDEALGKLSRISTRLMGFRQEKLALKLESKDASNCWAQYLRFIVDPKFAAGRLNEPTYSYDYLTAANAIPATSGNAPMLAATDKGRDRRVDWLFLNATNTGILQFDKEPERRYTFQEIISSVETILRKRFENVGQVEALPEDPEIDRRGLTPLKYLRRCMAPLFELVKRSGNFTEEQFHEQDVMVYPIVFGTTLGEFRPVDIFRISPDETTPIAKTAPKGSETPNPQLRGQSMGAFGGFLDQDWRLSDMLRGRLGGAERLITAILPDSDARTVAV